MTEQPFQIPASLVEILSNANSVVVLTGAGISAESGVPTFRDAQTGLWEKYQAEELATPGAFQRDPKLVWEWYEWRRGLISNSNPNPGHYAIVEMERRFPEFTLITQNVDGLHKQAGSGAYSPIIELHGNIFRNKCIDENIIINQWKDTGEIPPRCPYCGAYLRPDVVWFGEMLSQDSLEAAWQASQSCQVFLSVGTSNLVEPAASLPFMASRNGATVVEINPNTTPLTQTADFYLSGFSGVVLPKIVELLWGNDEIS